MHCIGSSSRDDKHPEADPGPLTDANANPLGACHRLRYGVIVSTALHTLIPQGEIMRSRFRRFACPLVLLTVLVAGLLEAQTLGTVTGEVKDSSGAAVAGATITVTNTATNGVRIVTTNDDGLYTIPALVPGMYDVKAEKQGFKSTTRTGVELQVQQTARIDFGLEVGQVSETIEVSGAAPLLTTENATVGTVIEQKRITDLPLNGRNFLSLVALSPNVTYGFAQAAQAAGRQGGSRANVTMSLAGSRSTWSNYTLDGITNTDINFNLYIVLPSVEALQEFKVQTGIYPAEFGRTAGQVNVSTRGGSNEYHGSVFEFLRNDKLDARPYFFKDPESPTQTAPAKSPYRQNQYGFTLGGSGTNPEGIQWQEPPLLHGELRRIQIAHDYDAVFHNDDTGYAGGRFLGGPNSACRIR